MKKVLAVLLALTLAGIPSLTSLRADLDPRDSESPYGVLSFLAWNHDWNNHQYTDERLELVVKLMAEAGVGFVRMDFLWDDIEPAPGKFDFSKYDKIIDLLGSHNIKVLGLLSYNACWAGEYWNSAPKPELFAAYAGAVASHFKTRVKYWEVWNEPDDAIYWRNQDGMKAYTELLKSAYPALKKADPTCVVLMGGVSRTIAASIRQIYRNGGKDFFDVVAFHPFVDPNVSGAERTLRGIYNGVMKVMAEFGDESKDIWLTEVGCPGVRGEAAGWWLGKAPNEEEQAVWVKKAYNEAREMKNVKKIFWAFFQDTPDYFKNAVDYFGLVRGDFSKKPAFEIYRRMIDSSHSRPE